MQATYFRLGAMFETIRSKYSSVLQSGQLFSDASMKYIKEEASKDSPYVATILNVLKVGTLLLSPWITMKSKYVIATT